MGGPPNGGRGCSSVGARKTIQLRHCGRPLRLCPSNRPGRGGREGRTNGRRCRGGSAGRGRCGSRRNLSLCHALQHRQEALRARPDLTDKLRAAIGDAGHRRIGTGCPHLRGASLLSSRPVGFFLALSAAAPFVGEHDAPHVIGQVALEAAGRCTGTLALGDLLVVVAAAGAGGHPDLDHRDGVERACPRTGTGGGGRCRRWRPAPVPIRCSARRPRQSETGWLVPFGRSGGHRPGAVLVEGLGYVLLDLGEPDHRGAGCRRSGRGTGRRGCDRPRCGRGSPVTVWLPRPRHGVSWRR